MRYSCHHCQRIDFVELTQAPMASPGLEGPLTRANDPIERVYIPLRGVALHGVPQPLEMTGQSAGRLWAGILDNQGCFVVIDTHFPPEVPQWLTAQYF